MTYEFQSTPHGVNEYTDDYPSVIRQESIPSCEEMPVVYRWVSNEIGTQWIDTSNGSFAVTLEIWDFSRPGVWTGWSSYESSTGDQWDDTPEGLSEALAWLHSQGPPTVMRRLLGPAIAGIEDSPLDQSYQPCTGQCPCVRFSDELCDYDPTESVFWACIQCTGEEQSGVSKTAKPSKMRARNLKDSLPHNGKWDVYLFENSDGVRLFDDYWEDQAYDVQARINWRFGDILQKEYTFAQEVRIHHSFDASLEPVADPGTTTGDCDSEPS